MDDISSGEVSCFCGWIGTIGDISLNFKISNFLICPKCGSEDLIYASKVLEKKLNHRKSLYLSQIRDSIVFSESKNIDLSASEKKLSLFVSIVNKIYLFDTSYKLPGLGSSYIFLEDGSSTIKDGALQFIENQQLKTTYPMENPVNEIWGKINFATKLAFYSEIAEQVEKDVDQNEPFEISAWG